MTDTLGHTKALLEYIKGKVKSFLEDTLENTHCDLQGCEFFWEDNEELYERRHEKVRDLWHLIDPANVLYGLRSFLNDDEVPNEDDVLILLEEELGEGESCCISCYLGSLRDLKKVKEWVWKLGTE